MYASAAKNAAQDYYGNWGGSKIYHPSGIMPDASS
jgi:hypothetical protein